MHAKERWLGSLYNSLRGIEPLRLIVASTRSWFHSLRHASEAKRRVDLIVRNQTDLHRWSQVASFTENWDKRAPFAAALCANSRVVCDLGCGMQVLRSLLPHYVTYLPADLVPRTDDTALCDLNQNQLPEEYLRRADTATMLGVAEYLYDVPTTIRILAGFVNTLIISYNPLDFISVDRRAMGWVNDFRLAEFVTIINTSGFTVCDICLVDSGQVVILASTRG